MDGKFKVGDWLISSADCSVEKSGVKSKLEPKAMDVLMTLVSANGTVVSREDIFSKVWKNQIVADHVLYNLIANLRKTLESNPQKPSYIVTVPKKGYRLGKDVCLIEEANPATHAVAETASIQSHTDNSSQTELRKSQKTMRQLGTVGIVIFIISLLFIFTPSMDMDADPNVIASKEGGITPGSSHPYPSIAVLPFDVFDGNEDTAYFADGLAEELIHHLTSINELVVISRTSSFSFRGKNVDIPTIARKLDSRYLVEGSVRSNNEKFRVTVQLIDAKSDKHVWSSVFDTEEKDIFSLQQNISETITKSLLPDNDQNSITTGKLSTVNEQAYLHYIRGQSMMASETVQDAWRAIDEMQKALDIDPNYARAHLAVAWNAMFLWSRAEFIRDDAWPMAENAIDKALEIDPFMAEAYSAKGLKFTYDRMHENAFEAFRKALELKPNLLSAHLHLAYLHRTLQNWDEAVKHYTIALSQDPLAKSTNFNIADISHRAGKVDNALNQFKHCLSLFPDFADCQLGVAFLYQLVHKNNEASNHLAMAKSMVAEDDYAYLMASLKNTYLIGDVKGMKLFSEKLFEKIKRAPDYGIMTHYKAKTGELNQWMEYLEGEQEKYKNNPLIGNARAHTYYLKGDCESAIRVYNQYKRFERFLEGNYFNIASGISHYTNLAHCYSQLGNTEMSAEYVAKVQQQLDSYDTGNFFVAGQNIIKAKLALVEEDTTYAELILKSFNEYDSKLKWLLEIDPAFRTSKENISLNN